MAGDRSEIVLVKVARWWTEINNVVRGKTVVNFISYSCYLEGNSTSYWEPV